MKPKTKRPYAIPGRRPARTRTAKVSFADLARLALLPARDRKDLLRRVPRLAILWDRVRAAFQELESFVRQHRGCDALIATKNEQTTGCRLSVTCSCGAVFERQVSLWRASQGSSRPGS